MIRLEVLVEEPSAEEALRLILPGLLEGRASFKLINMRNKGRLLRELPARLRGYERQIAKGEDLRIVVLVDRDKDDCSQLKKRMEAMAREAGLATKSNPTKDGSFWVVNRIAVEELEAWFIGDTKALRKAFSKLPARFPSSFSHPDNGGSWERLYRFLKQHGIYKSSYPKIEAARKISLHIDPLRNNSLSFRHFCSGVLSLL